MEHSILLGWSNYSTTLNFKVMEVVSTNGDALTFGLPVFVQSNKNSSRITLPYSSGHSMVLQYDAKRSLLIFSHLNGESNKSDKIPDESFSGFQLTPDQLIYKNEVTFDHNEASMPRTKIEYDLDGNK
jgi:hypothetical protein